MEIEPTVQLRNVDCVEFMSGLSDGFFDLTLADPPYGIGKDWKRRRRAAALYDESGYDNERPSRKCIEEIERSH
jgi:DNA modification methylase